jgi:hypothetical protein
MQIRRLSVEIRGPLAEEKRFDLPVITPRWFSAPLAGLPPPRRTRPCAVAAAAASPPADPYGCGQGVGKWLLAGAGVALGWKALDVFRRRERRDQLRAASGERRRLNASLERVADESDDDW